MKFGVKRYVGRAIVKNTGFGCNFAQSFVQVGPQSGPKTPQERPQNGNKATKRRFEKTVRTNVYFSTPRGTPEFWTILTGACPGREVLAHLDGKTVVFA